MTTSTGGSQRSCTLSICPGPSSRRPCGPDPLGSPSGLTETQYRSSRVWKEQLQRPALGHRTSNHRLLDPPLAATSTANSIVQEAGDTGTRNPLFEYLV